MQNTGAQRAFRGHRSAARWLRPSGRRTDHVRYHREPGRGAIRAVIAGWFFAHPSAVHTRPTNANTPPSCPFCCIHCRLKNFVGLARPGQHNRASGRRTCCGRHLQCAWLQPCGSGSHRQRDDRKFAVWARRHFSKWRRAKRWQCRLVRRRHAWQFTARHTARGRSRWKS